MSDDLQWYDIEPHSIHVRGLDSSSVLLTADAVLATTSTRWAPAVLGFTTSIAICQRPTVRLEYRAGFYGDLNGFRADLVAVRNGETKKAMLDLDSLSLSIYRHDRGPKSGIIVEGHCTSSPPVDYLSGFAPKAPTPDRRVADWLLNNKTDTFSEFHFAFCTSQVDPPYLDSMIRDIDELNAYLRSLRSNDGQS